MGSGPAGKDSCIEIDLGHRRSSSQIKYLYIVYEKLMLRLNNAGMILESRHFQVFSL